MASVTDITLVLFDIDGTLLHTHGAGSLAFSRALKAVFGGFDDLSDISFAGATDLDVFRRIMSKHGLTPTPEQENAFFDRLPHELTQTTESREVTSYPGVQELLTALSSMDDVLVGLVTGNTEECAEIKLQRGDLHGHFVLGAFGREHADRADIARLAVRRADERLQPTQRMKARFLIGDTPSDISAAKVIGAVSIAVATGAYEVQALRDAGADHVLDGLSETGAVLAIMGLNT